MENLSGQIFWLLDGKVRKFTEKEGELDDRCVGLFATDGEMI